MEEQNTSTNTGEPVKAETRYFIPVDPNYRVAGKLGCVRYWQWTKRNGLVCVTRDGVNWKSEWGTLPAFLKAVRERRETAVRQSSVIPAFSL